MKNIAKYFLLLQLVITSVMADDSDIYINDPGAAPYAMLVLDYRPNIFSNTCSNVGDPVSNPGDAASCLDNLGETETSGAYATNLDGTLTLLDASLYEFITSPTGLNKTDGDSLEPWDQMVAVYAVALQQIPKEINIGLAISHANTVSSCENSSGSKLNRGGADALNCSNGGYIIKEFTNVSPDDTTGADALIAKLRALPSADTGSVTHPFQGAELYYEISRYLRGLGVVNAHLGWDSFVGSGGKGTPDYNLNDANNQAADFSYTAASVNPPGVDPDEGALDGGGPISGSSVYENPYSVNSNVNECTKTYVINNFFKESTQESDTDSDIESDSDLGISSLSSDPFLDLVTAFATEEFANSQTVQSIFIAGPQAVNAGKVPDYSLAGTPEGEDEIGPFSREDARQFLDGLKAAFSAILSKSATFVSASVPVNVFDRVEVVDNVYLAIFKADQDANPFWPGNVKKLKIIENPSDPDNKLIVSRVDQTEQAFADDGRIKYSALTYWTDEDGFDVQEPDPDDADEYTNRDGRSANRGGAGQRIPGFMESDGTAGFPGINNDNTGVNTNVQGSPAPRQLYTQPTTSNPDTDGDGLIPLNADTTLSTDTEIQTALGAANSSDAVELLAWFRGITGTDTDGDGQFDTFSGAAGSRDQVEARSWVMGDALHSQPLPVNYGCANPSDDPATCVQRIRLFFGTNDGVFHMVKNTTNAGAESGEEIAGFIPHSLLGLADILSGGPTTPVHPYGMDGRPTALILDQNNDGNISSSDGDKVYVFVGMRRGGKQIFAFDATDPDSFPELLWSIDENTANFSELGMTFSNPVVGVVQTGINSSGEQQSELALFFGGGFYGGWNSTYTARVGKDLEGFMGPDTEGNAFYVVNAITGALIWKATGGASTSTLPNTSSSNHFVHADMDHSIASEVSILDSDGNGYIDRAYVGDTGGNVWRFNMPEASAASGTDIDGRESWFAYKFASLGVDAVSGESQNIKDANDRRFFHAPSVVQTFDDNGTPNNATDDTSIDIVVITSGDRAHPREEEVQNKAFMLKDVNIGAGNINAVPLTTSDLGDVSDCVTGNEEGSACSASLTNGWMFDLEASTGGEKGLSKPLTIAGTVFFTSYLPNGEPDADGSADICSAPEGSSRLYAVQLLTGRAATNLTTDIADNRFQEIGDGLLGDVSTFGSDAVLIPGKGLDDGPIQPIQTSTYFKIFWREKGFDTH